MTDFIQLHLLTSYPPANLNRDDLGRPKTAIVGGTQRLRISSQSLKRAWRTSDLFTKLPIGTRTKDLGNLVYDELVTGGVQPERADSIAKAVAGVFGRPKQKGDARQQRQTEQLVHIDAKERAKIEAMIARVKKGKTPANGAINALLGSGHASPDIALFGRMIAASPDHNVEAAAQVAHAITVHRVTIEDDYFAAVDDLKIREEDMGAAHIGTTEFSAGVFYQYVSIDRGLLSENLDGDRAMVTETLRALVEACATVAPSGKQCSFGSRARASYLLAERGSQQPRSLSVAFLRDVQGDDILESAVDRLQQTSTNMDTVYGPCAERRASFDAQKGEGTLGQILDFVGGR